MYLKRITSLILSAVIIFSLTSCGFESTAAAASSDIVLADLTNKSAVSDAGLAASSLYTKSGDFSAKWSGSMLNSEISIPISNADKLQNGYIEASIYSSAKTGMKFGFVLDADNPETAEKDYWYSSVTVNWTGWKKIAFRITDGSDTDGEADTDNMTWEEYDKYISSKEENASGGESSFKTVGSPLGLNKISAVILRPKTEGNSVIKGTELFFDKITFGTEKSADSVDVNSTGSTGSSVEPYVLYDFSSQAACGAKPAVVYSTDYSEDGGGSGKFAAPNLDKNISFSAPDDWTKYNTLNIEAYNVKNTGSTMYIGIDSENEETDGADYYLSRFSFSWENEWRTVKYSFYPNGDKKGDFNETRTPAGWDKINGFSFQTTYAGNTISADTVCYFKKIYLTYEDDSSGDALDNTKDYIPKAEEKNINKDIELQLKKTTPRKQHPRIDTTPDQLEKNIELYKQGDPYLVKTYNNAIAQANSYLQVPDPEYGLPDGKRLVSTDREAIKPLALAYRLTGEKKYRDRLLSALETMASWPDWNPSHTLCTSEAAHAFAQAYDLCYDMWTADERRIIRNGMMKNAIEPALGMWRKDIYPSDTTNNWQEVCSGGFGVAALAIIDEPGYTDVCAEMVTHTVRTLPKGLAAYAPDGGFPEGAAYWEYASGFFFRYDHALFNTLGTDFGLSDLPGLSETGYFPIASVGPAGSFNFSDASVSSSIRHNAMFWIAERYNKPEIASYFYRTTNESDSWEEFLTYRSNLIGDDYRASLKRDYRYNTDELDVIYSRASWYDNNATWLAAKGGSNAAAHGDLDIGQFVLDMQGVRWFSDLGSSYYEGEGYWNLGVGGSRWHHYRKRAEAHNTLVINPDENEDQYALANCKFTDVKTRDNAMYAVLDMSNAYPDAKEVKRGFALINNRNDFIVQDEIKTDSPIEVYSFFTTLQQITIDEKNPSVAYLTAQGGQKVRMDITSPQGASWGQMDAVPLDTSPNPSENTMAGFKNDKYHKLFVHLNNAVNPTISVSVKSVYDENDESASAQKLLPISSWDEYLKENAAIDNLYVDKIAVDGFSKSNSVYSVDGILGTVTADYDSEKVSVDIVQAQKIGDTAICTVTDKETGNSSKYYVTFNDVRIEVDPTAFEKINITNAEASHTPEPGNTPDHTFDGDLNTRWSADNESWIIWDLDGEYNMNQILLAFWKGDARATKFKIYTSSDRNTWNLQYEGQSSGSSAQLETFKFKNTVKAKYVKFVGSGNTDNEWNSILEVYIPRAMLDFTDISGHWAEQAINQMRMLKLVNGTSDTTFTPDANVTRAEFIAMISRCIGLEEKTYNNEFNDVYSDDWYADTVEAAYSGGIIPAEMIDGGAFKPKNDITREEAAAVLVLAYKSISADESSAASTDRFGDKSEINPAYDGYIGEALSRRFLTGRSTGTFAPKATATRAEAATILKRLYIAKTKLSSGTAGEQQQLD